MYTYVTCRDFYMRMFKCIHAYIPWSLNAARLVAPWDFPTFLPAPACVRVYVYMYVYVCMYVCIARLSISWIYASNTRPDLALLSLRAPEYFSAFFCTSRLSKCTPEWFSVYCFLGTSSLSKCAPECVSAVLLCVALQVEVSTLVALLFQIWDM
jgi:hypothetical protein